MEAMIRSDTALRMEAIKVLLRYLGAVNTERFINSIKADRFDYTEWQRRLWSDKSIEQIHDEAAAYYYSRHPKEVTV
jgi:hypothetical protein